jgi:hypothetical protein
MICSNECSFNPVTIKRRRLSVVVGWRECWDRVSVISLPMGKMLVSVPGIYTEHLLLISEGIEPSTFSVLTKCDNRYTMKPCETHGRCSGESGKQTNIYSESQKSRTPNNSKLESEPDHLSRRIITTECLTKMLKQSRAPITGQFFCQWNLRQRQILFQVLPN